MSMTNVPEIFGSMVFNDEVMEARLPKVTYKSLKKTIQQGSPLELEVANVVANAMKRFAERIVDVHRAAARHHEHVPHAVNAGKPAGQIIA